jgi:hypothetical protein
MAEGIYHGLVQGHVSPSVAELIDAQFMPEPGCARVVGLGHSSCHKCGYYTDGYPGDLCPLEFQQDPIRGGKLT